MSQSHRFIGGATDEVFQEQSFGLLKFQDIFTCKQTYKNTEGLL